MQIHSLLNAVILNVKSNETLTYKCTYIMFLDIG
jgi:hypothetical protein